MKRLVRYGLCLTALGGLSLLSVVALSGCGRGNAAATLAPVSPEAPEVATIRAEQQALRHTVEQPGQIEGFEQTPLYAKIAGYVAKWNADIGDRVKAGQVLAELSVPELREELRQKEAAVTLAEAQVTEAERTLTAAEATVKRSEAALKLAEAGRTRAESNYKRWEAEYARVRNLLPGGAVTPSTMDETTDAFRSAQSARDENRASINAAAAAYDESKAQRDKAAASVRVAEARRQGAEADRRHTAALLDYTTIRAPFDGVVSRRGIDIGQLVQPPSGVTAAPLFVVTRTDPVRIFVEVPEADAPLVGEGTPALIRVQSLREQEFHGKVMRSSWVLDTQSRTLRAQIDLPNPDGRLRPGMYATARITVEQSAALTLPAAAILTQDEEAAVMAVADGRAVRLPVRLGARHGDRVEVLQKQTAPARRGGPAAWGAFTGDEVIAARPGTLTDGQELRGSVVVAARGMK
jgi:multidrug efflux pump subunit AcrA (membrane-fusion protein)